MTTLFTVTDMLSVTASLHALRVAVSKSRGQSLQPAPEKMSHFAQVELAALQARLAVCQSGILDTQVRLVGLMKGAVQRSMLELRFLPDGSLRVYGWESDDGAFKVTGTNSPDLSWSEVLIDVDVWMATMRATHGVEFMGSLEVCPSKCLSAEQVEGRRASLEKFRKAGKQR